MNKIIVVIAIVFAFTLGTVFSADIATAVKPVTEDVVNTLPLQQVAGKDIDLDTETGQTSLLFYGSELCTLQMRNPITSVTPESMWYIQFTEETLVRDLCEDNNGNVKQDAINLQGDGDQIFQAGDFIILKNAREQFRQQTP